MYEMMCVRGMCGFWGWVVILLRSNNGPTHTQHVSPLLLLLLPSSPFPPHPNTNTNTNTHPILINKQKQIDRLMEAAARLGVRYKRSKLAPLLSLPHHSSGGSVGGAVSPSPQKRERKKEGRGGEGEGGEEEVAAVGMEFDEEEEGEEDEEGSGRAPCFREGCKRRVAPGGGTAVRVAVCMHDTRF